VSTIQHCPWVPPETGVTDHPNDLHSNELATPTVEQVDTYAINQQHQHEQQQLWWTPQYGYIFPLLQAPQVFEVPNVIQMPSTYEYQEPIFVNVKRYNRIMQRRKIRRAAAARNKFMHKSRSEWANRRERGPGGRFKKCTEQVSSQTIKQEEQL
jgi:hypothetical protein